MEQEPLPAEWTDALTVRANNDNLPRDTGMWIASVSVYKVLRMARTTIAALTEKHAACEKQCAEYERHRAHFGNLLATAEARVNELEDQLASTQQSLSEFLTLVEESAPGYPDREYASTRDAFTAIMAEIATLKAAKYEAVADAEQTLADWKKEREERAK